MQQPPPLPKKVPDIRMPGERSWFVGIFGWLPDEKPTFDKGRASTFTDPSKITLQGTPKVTEGGEFGLAIGAHNTLRFAAFQTQAAGDFTTPVEIIDAGVTYPAATYVSTSYRLRNFKLSYEYLTWPFPVESRRFRLKTLYQVHYTQVRNIVNAPNLPIVDSADNPLLDSTGQPLNYAATNTHGFFSPAFGLGVTKYVSRNFRLEANATGFTIPHHTTIWDTDVSANFRAGHLELRLGAKAFHYKTSTQADYYTRNTMASVFVGVRWCAD
jgi:hypothetical protein